MDRDVIRHRLDGVVAYLVEHSDTIVKSASDLGIPLDDVMCHCIRQALKRRAVDTRQQLFDIGRKEVDA